MGRWGTKYNHQKTKMANQETKLALINLFRLLTKGKRQMLRIQWKKSSDWRGHYHYFQDASPHFLYTHDKHRRFDLPLCGWISLWGTGRTSLFLIFIGPRSHSLPQSVTRVSSGMAEVLLTKAWRHHFQCRQCSILSSLVVQIPAVVTAMVFPCQWLTHSLKTLLKIDWIDPKVSKACWLGYLSNINGYVDNEVKYRLWLL